MQAKTLLQLECSRSKEMLDFLSSKLKRRIPSGPAVYESELSSSLLAWLVVTFSLCDLAGSNTARVAVPISSPVAEYNHRNLDSVALVPASILSRHNRRVQDRCEQSGNMRTADKYDDGIDR